MPELISYGQHVIVIALALLVPLFAFYKVAGPPSRALRKTHRKLGIHPSHSNLNEQQSSSSHQAQFGRPGRLQSLFIYPVKSCQGVELQSSRVVPTGLEHDRLFTFAQLREAESVNDDKQQQEENGDAGQQLQELQSDGKAETWQFLTQRQCPRLATINVDLWLPQELSNTTRDRKAGIVIARFPWRQRGITGALQWLFTKVTMGLLAEPEKEFVLPLDFPSPEDIEAKAYRYANITIWNETVTALNMASDLPPEMKEYLGLTRPLGLFRMDPARRRPVFRCAPRRDEAKYQPIVDFHDAYPLHLINLNSVQDLGSKMQKDEVIPYLDARRFRANMIVSGIEAYDEETWRQIRLSHKVTSQKEAEGLFDVSCRTVRCKMPNVDAMTGVRHRAEPDHSLRRYRDVDAGAPKWGCLGMQLCPLFPDAGNDEKREFVIEVGMECTVLQTGQHLYIPQ